MKVLALFCLFLLPMLSQLPAQTGTDTLSPLPLDKTWTFDHRSYSESMTGQFYLDTVAGTPVRALTGWKKQLSEKVTVYKWVYTLCSSGERTHETDDYRKDLGNQEEETIAVTFDPSGVVQGEVNWKRDVKYEVLRERADRLSERYGEGEGKHAICGTEFRRLMYIGNEMPQEKELSQGEAAALIADWKLGK